MSGASTLEPSIEHWLQVEDRCSVDRLQISDTDSSALYDENLHTMETDWIWPIRRACAEHTRQRVGRIVPGMHDQHVAPRTVQPCEHQDLGAHFEVAQSLAEALVEDQPGLWSTFVSLFRRGFWIEQRRLDPADWRQLILSIAQLILHSHEAGQVEQRGHDALKPSASSVNQRNAACVPCFN